MESSEFDVTLGGTEHLPFSANSLKFAASRSIEIAAMTCILRPSKTKLIFQSLPVHMRRRVMSHNAKRLPIKLRRGHLEQLNKSGLPTKQKRPSRKYRRRPGNLLQEYNRRKKRNMWLETHIWHAKRFHMIERWGYKIANAPCDKAFRACYRASSAHCLMQDISYYTPIKITGPENLLKDMFGSISSCFCGLSIGAKAYIDGKREGNIHLYEKDSYPFGYIGKINFIWTKYDNKKILWLFVHPSQIKQVESLLAELLSENTSPSNTNAEKRRKLTNNYSEQINIKSLPGAFNRFRLTGPKSHAILARSLKCIDDLKKIENNKWTLSSNCNELCLKEKYSYWENASKVMSPSQLPSQMVLGLVVRDPRLSRPQHRTKAINTNGDENAELFLDIPSLLPTSPLWDCNLHDLLRNEMLTNTQFIQHITKTQLVPGEVNINDPTLQSVPIVLIQRPGSQDPSFKKIGYGSGWDILIPPGYGLQFWQTFIMFGARSGGLRETENLMFEMGECYLPPDSYSGKEEEKRIETELRERYFKLPPSKRINYMKMAISTPFSCPWKLILNEWSNNLVDNFFVLRDRKFLSNFQDCILQKKQLPYLENSSSCLVPIYLRMVKKGNLKRNAIICLAEKEDLIITPNEPRGEDPNEKKRKQKRKEHIRNMKSQKRKRSKLKKNEAAVRKTKLQKQVKSEPSEYVKIMRELWLPNVKSCRHLCSKQIFGFVSQAAFSFTDSLSCGVGYVAYNGLNDLLAKSINQVLVRNVSSRKYRLANISIIKNQ